MDKAPQLPLFPKSGINVLTDNAARKEAGHDAPAMRIPCGVFGYWAGWGG